MTGFSSVEWKADDPQGDAVVICLDNGTEVEVTLKDLYLVLKVVRDEDNQSLTVVSV